MKTEKTVHILSHTHWDREWYLDSKYTNEWLVPFFDNLFAMLEKESDYKFILDGQMSMVDDWLEQLVRTGRSVHDAKGRLRSYVEKKRVVIGPYYLQPDWQIVSGEALVRNLFLGNKLAAGLGGSMKTGWLLDNFGQISQTAQIHARCGLRGLFVWRGVYMDPESVKSEFVWKAPDGTELPSIYLINSYRNAMRLASTPDLVDRRIADEVARMEHFNTTGQVLLMNGYDQDIEPDDVMSVLRQRKTGPGIPRVIQSTPEEYLDAVLAEKPVLPVLEGAQYTGRYISVFPGVMSARIYLKQQNDLSQHTLERIVEPLSSLNYLFGGEYEAGCIESLWKMLLKNHPHDSICGVSIDPVHTDMEYRHHSLQLLSAEKISRDLAEVCGRIDTSKAGKKSCLVVFNSSLKKRNAVIRFKDRFIALDDLPGLGWKTVDPDGDAAAGSVWVKQGAAGTAWRAGNGRVEIRIDDDGSFDLVHAETGKTYEGLGVFEDSGDAGDLYNYSWPDRDVVYSTRGNAARITLVHSSTVAAEFRIELTMRIPEGLSDDGRTRSGRLVDMPVVSIVRVETGSSVVSVSTRLRNTAKNHVLRALFPTGIDADHSHGGSPFDVTRRPVEIPDFDESGLRPELKAVIIGAREPKANSFFHGQGFADVSDGTHGLAVLNRGLPEYRVRKENRCIELTLFRGVAIIAGDINTRLGDAGPHMLTPDGQCLRDLYFDYAVYPHPGDVHSGDVVSAADDFAHPVLAAETALHAGPLPSATGEVELVSGTVTMSAFKRAERGGNFILRLYNPTGAETAVTLVTGVKCTGAWLCDLLERRENAVDVKDWRTVSFALGAKKILTLELQLERTAVPSANTVPAVSVDTTVKEDFSTFEAVPLVSEAEMHVEKARAALLAGRMDDVMFRRPALEAKISAILAEARYGEKDMRTLGLALNDARVKRRLHDYIAAYRKP